MNEGYEQKPYEGGFSSSEYGIRSSPQPQRPAEQSSGYQKSYQTNNSQYQLQQGTGNEDDEFKRIKEKYNLGAILSNDGGRTTNERVVVTSNDGGRTTNERVVVTSNASILQREGERQY